MLEPFHCIALLSGKNNIEERVEIQKKTTIIKLFMLRESNLLPRNKKVPTSSTPMLY
jgi:hypothetical protein